MVLTKKNYSYMTEITKTVEWCALKDHFEKMKSTHMRDLFSDDSKRFEKNSFVFEVSYDKTLVTFLTQNIQKVSFWLFIISSFFGLIALILINSSIRLSIYSKRFNIKTMQMVGATKRFIRKPFLWRSVKLGFLGAFISFLGLGIVIYYIDKKIPTLELLSDYSVMIYISSGIVIVAFIISWLSTFFATQRFLNLQTEELYY